MAPRQIKMPGKDNSDKEAKEVFSQFFNGPWWREATRGGHQRE